MAVREECDEEEENGGEGIVHGEVGGEGGDGGVVVLTDYAAVAQGQEVED